MGAYHHQPWQASSRQERRGSCRPRNPSARLSHSECQYQYVHRAKHACAPCCSTVVLHTTMAEPGRLDKLHIERDTAMVLRPSSMLGGCVGGEGKVIGRFEKLATISGGLSVGIAIVAVWKLVKCDRPRRFASQTPELTGNKKSKLRIRSSMPARQVPTRHNCSRRWLPGNVLNYPTSNMYHGT